MNGHSAVASMAPNDRPPHPNPTELSHRMSRFGPPLASVTPPTNLRRTASASSVQLLPVVSRLAEIQASHQKLLVHPGHGREHLHHVLFGKDVIQVPLKLADRNNEYVNLVLSQREFDLMAIHIPRYDEMRPEDLVEQINYLVKEAERTRKTQQRQASPSKPNGSDTSALFQARVLELEYEVSRLQTKLSAARSLQTNLTDENTSLRSQIRELEHHTVEFEKLQMKNELLRDQAVRAFAKLTKLKSVLGEFRSTTTYFSSQLQHLKSHQRLSQDSMSEYLQHKLLDLVHLSKQRERILENSYLDEKRERQLISEKYHEVSGRIRVFCRLRPPQPSASSMALVTPKPNHLLVERSSKEFSFDRVFGPECSQADVYDQMEPVVVSFADGFNACIMAYGQTGSGKTFTMMGTSEHAGMIPRALDQVFSMLQSRQVTYHDQLSISMMEIYNDQIRDLLGDVILKNENDLTKRTVVLDGQSSTTQVQQILNEGNRNRNIASTKMNVESSRSHALVFLNLQSQHKTSYDIKTSTLCLVDLAGSERLSRSQVEGDRLKETQHINKSLAALGDVMYALQHKAKHTPYRNSKLTFVLRDMLGAGQSKTLLMLQLSPDDQDVEETLCSLQFGARVSQIAMGAVKQSTESGELVKWKESARVAMQEKAAVENQVELLQQSYEAIKDQLEALKQTNQSLQDRVLTQASELQHLQSSSPLGLVVDTAATTALSAPPSPALSTRSSSSTSSVSTVTSTSRRIPSASQSRRPISSRPDAFSLPPPRAPATRSIRSSPPSPASSVSSSRSTSRIPKPTTTTSTTTSTTASRSLSSHRRTQSSSSLTASSTSSRLTSTTSSRITGTTSATSSRLTTKSAVAPSSSSRVRPRSTPSSSSSSSLATARFSTSRSTSKTTTMWK